MFKDNVKYMALGKSGGNVRPKTKTKHKDFKLSYL